jgi:two-component system sensor histidine kinase BaeS
VVPASDSTFALLHKEVFRLIHLLEDLQRLTRADASKGHIARQEIVVSEFVDQVAALYTPQIVAKRIRLETYVADDAQQVMADPDQLLQILSNLMQNACQYTPEGGRVKVIVERKQTQICITVENSAEPIAMKDLSLLFERFYRPDESRSRDSGGAGIGLAIVKQLVEAHQGKVGVENSANGIRVWFTLPVQLPDSMTEKAGQGQGACDRPDIVQLHP